MKIDVRGLLGSSGEQRVYSLTVPVSLLRPSELELDIEPAQVDLVLTGTPQGVLASGTLSATAHLGCGRCLASYTEPLSTEFAHLFVHSVAPEHSRSEARELGAGALVADEDRDGRGTADDDEDGLDTSPIVDGQIDLAPVLAEVLDLALPMQPLCKPDCQGLCTRCGKSLSEGPCGCKIEDIDPRMSVLAKLLPRDDRGGPGNPGNADDERKE